MTVNKLLFTAMLLDGWYHIMRYTPDRGWVNANVSPFRDGRLADKACVIMSRRLLANKAELDRLGYTERV